jgi:glucose-6-phosphate 1-dehydrogenase
MHDAVKQFSEDGEVDEDLWKRFAANLHYVPGDVKDPQLFVALREKLDAIGQANVLFYLSTQPSYYHPLSWTGSGIPIWPHRLRERGGG